MSNKPNGTLYVGVTADLVRRVHEHRTGIGSVFVKRYRLHNLVWFERHEDILAAIQREKRLKDWDRAWKVRLIHMDNSEWRNRYSEII